MAFKEIIFNHKSFIASKQLTEIFFNIAYILIDELLHHSHLNFSTFTYASSFIGIL